MFKRVYLEISNVCNVQCTFCPIVDKDKKIMDLTEFESTLKQVAPLTEIICLHLLGEPLAHPKFKEIIGLCEQYNTQIDLTTNGLLIHKYGKFIAESKAIRQINFSLQVFADNFPHKPLEGYLNPILNFTTLAQEIRPELYINYRLWNQNSSANDNEEIFQKIETHFDIEINRNVEVEAIKSKRIWNRLYLHFDSRFEWPAMSLPNQGAQGRCHGTINHIGIHADGTVVPCCLDKSGIIDLGNLKSQSLASILKSKRFLTMRKGFQEGKRIESLCQHCTFINRFKKKAKAV